MTKYWFSFIRKFDKKMYTRLLWQERKKKMNRQPYFSKRWEREHNQGISGTNAGRARKFRGKICEKCGVTKKLVAHHKNLNQSDNRKENIQTLCFQCHNELHLGKESYI